MESEMEPEPTRHLRSPETRRCRAISLARQANRRSRDLQRTLWYLQSELKYCRRCQKAASSGQETPQGCHRLERYLQQVEAVILDLSEAVDGI